MDEYLGRLTREVLKSTGSGDCFGFPNPQKHISIPQGTLQGKRGHRPVRFDNCDTVSPVKKFEDVIAEARAYNQYGTRRIQFRGIDEPLGFFAGLVPAVKIDVAYAQRRRTAAAFLLMHI
jgi:hypothetical protein